MKSDCLNVTLSVINWKLASVVISHIEDLDSLLKEKFDIDDSVVLSWTVQSMGEEEPQSEGGYRYSIVEVELGYMYPNNPFLVPELWSKQILTPVAKIAFEHGKGDYSITNFSGFKNRQSLDEKKETFFKKISEIFAERSPVPA